MRRLASFLLLGTLSMFFAEVCSGASQAWFVNGWGLLVTFPLYLTHCIFFLWLAFRCRRTSLTHLYLLGVLFGLYESWITKVLWGGYFDASGPGFGSFLGVGVVEFPILVFFWHPVMSFILPVLVFEVLTGGAMASHRPILARSGWKTASLVALAIVAGAFAANGNGFSIVMANLSIIGTLVIAILLLLASRKTDLRAVVARRFGSVAVVCYLVFLYLAAFFLLLPERLPDALAPYLAIIGFYLLAVILFILRPKSSDRMSRLDGGAHYSRRHAAAFAAVMLVSANLACLLPPVGLVVLVLAYLLLAGGGVALFASVAGGTVRRALRRNL